MQQLNLSIAHTIAMHSFSTVAYDLGAPANFLLAYAMGNIFHHVSEATPRLTPYPMHQFAGQNLYQSLVTLINTGALHNWDFISSNLFCRSSLHWTVSGSSFLVTSLNGAVRLAKLLTNFANISLDLMESSPESYCEELPHSLPASLYPFGY